MFLITNGYIQDGFKMLVYLIPLVYLIAKRRSLNLRHYGLFLAGFLFLFFGNLIDFLDEFDLLRRTFDSPEARHFQDFCEDIVGFTLGFIFLAAGLFLELGGKRKK